MCVKYVLSQILQTIMFAFFMITFIEISQDFFDVFQEAKTRQGVTQFVQNIQIQNPYYYRTRNYTSLATQTGFSLFLGAVSSLYNKQERDFFVTRTDLSLGCIKTKLYIAKYDLEKYIIHFTQSMIIPRPDLSKDSGLENVTFYMNFAKEESYGYRWYTGQSDRLKSPL